MCSDGKKNWKRGSVEEWKRGIVKVKENEAIPNSTFLLELGIDVMME